MDLIREIVALMSKNKLNLAQNISIVRLSLDIIIIIITHAYYDSRTFNFNDQYIPNMYILEFE